MRQVISGEDYSNRGNRDRFTKALRSDVLGVPKEQCSSQDAHSGGRGSDGHFKNILVKDSHSLLTLILETWASRSGFQLSLTLY